MPHRAENAIKSLETSTAQWAMGRGDPTNAPRAASERETSSFGGCCPYFAGWLAN